MTVRLLSFILLALLTFPATGGAQVDRAALTGIVHDSSGAVVPGASIKLTPIAGGAEREVKATEDRRVPGHWSRLGRVARRDRRHGLPDGRTDRQARGRSARAARRDAAGRRGQRAGARRRRHSAARHAVGGARHGREQKEISTLPLALRNWDDMLFLVPGVQGYRYTEESGGTSAGQDRRHQRPRPPLAAEQLPARRRRQQQHLDQRAGAVDAALASVNRRDRRIQSGDDPVHGRIRPGAGRHDLGDDQVGQQRAARDDLLLLPRRAIRRQHLLLESLRIGQADQQSESVRRQPRRSAARRARAFFFADYEGTRITRGVLRTGTVPTADQRRGVFTSAIRDPLTGSAVREQHDSRLAHRSGRRGDSRDGADAQCRGQQQLHPSAGHHRRQRPFLGALRSARRRRTTTSSSATATTSGSASCPGGSAGCSTAARRRPGGATI